MISFDNKLGSIEEILNRSMFSTLSNALIKSKKVSLFPFSRTGGRKSPIFTPVKTISFTPLLAISLAAFTTFVMLSERLAPLANGMVQ